MSKSKQCVLWGWLIAAGCVATVAGSAMATAAEDDAQQESAATTALSPVAQALSKARIMNGSVNLGADYFIYVQSASWCGPCKREMPELVKIYPEMKAGNVELILVGLDGTEQGALDYLQSYAAPFPGVHFKDEALQQLPGFELARAVPQATVVDKQGRVVAKGHGSLARKWQQIVMDDQED